MTQQRWTSICDTIITSCCSINTSIISRYSSHGCDGCEVCSGAGGGDGGCRSARTIEVQPRSETTKRSEKTENITRNKTFVNRALEVSLFFHTKEHSKSLCLLNLYEQRTFRGIVEGTFSWTHLVFLPVLHAHPGGFLYRRKGAPTTDGTRIKNAAAMLGTHTDYIIQDQPRKTPASLFITTNTSI